jgi:hypothetical protein
MALLLHKGSTIILRLAVLAIGAVILALCVFAVPAGISSDNTGYYRPILWGLYVPAVPFFLAIFQTMKLLNLIDKNQAFSGAAVNILKYIKYCAVTISAMFAAGMPYIFHAAQRDDAPGVVLIGLVIIGASLVIATFAAVLQKLLQNAVEIKSENDLTV